MRAAGRGAVHAIGRARAPILSWERQASSTTARPARRRQRRRRRRHAGRVPPCHHSRPAPPPGVDARAASTMPEQLQRPAPGQSPAPPGLSPPGCPASPAPPAPARASGVGSPGAVRAVDLRGGRSGAGRPGLLGPARTRAGPGLTLTKRRSARMVMPRSEPPPRGARRWGPRPGSAPGPAAPAPAPACILLRGPAPPPGRPPRPPASPPAGLTARGSAPPSGPPSPPSPPGAAAGPGPRGAFPPPAAPASPAPPVPGPAPGPPAPPRASTPAPPPRRAPGAAGRAGGQQWRGGGAFLILAAPRSVPGAVATALGGPEPYRPPRPLSTGPPRRGKPWRGRGVRKGAGPDASATPGPRGRAASLGPRGSATYGGHAHGGHGPNPGVQYLAPVPGAAADLRRGRRFPTPGPSTGGGPSPRALPS